MKQYLPVTLVFVACLFAASVRAGDWPQFRFDAGRTAAAPDELPAQLQLRWTRTLPAPRPAFPDQIRLAYDASYEPVVLGRTLFVPSMVTDSVTALDTETGAERWRFIADGPVRFAPVAWEGKVYFVSDDGHLYCLNDDGSLRWKFRGLPEGRQDRKVLGHGRLVSLWPARGGPVLGDGVVYFAAGIWPTEGVFVHAVDGDTGRAVWSNTTSHLIPKSNWDHGIGFDAGLTPQGYLAIVGNRLIVPCGTQLPAFLDLKTGELQTYTMGWGGRLGLPKGCWFVAGIGKYLSHAGDLYDVTRPNEERLAETKPGDSDYKPMLYPGGFTRLDIERANQRELDRFRQPVLTSDVMYESDQSIVARDLTAYSLQERTEENVPAHRAQDEVPDNFGGVLRQLWELPSKLDVHIKAGSRLYAGGPGTVAAIETAGPEPKVVWRAEIEGTPTRMLAADAKLFVVTAEGSILAFAAPSTGEVPNHLVTTAPPPSADEWTQRATAILEATGVRDGYALVLGLDRGRLVEELVRQSDLHVIAVDGNAGKVSALRERLYLAGLYGTRTSVLVGNPVIYLSDGPSCMVFDPATGQPANRLALPEGTQGPWSNLRVSGDYLIGTGGPHVLCMDRRTGKLVWRVEAARAALYLAVGGNKVFCAELANPQRGEDETRDGTIFALNLATGERLWQRTGGARLRYSSLLDVVVTPAAFYRGSDGEPLPQQSGPALTRLVVTGGGLPKTGLPGLVAGKKLLTGNDETLAVYDLASTELMGEPLMWVRRGCTGTRASTHLMTTRYCGNSAWIDLDSRQITPFFGIRPACSINNNLYPANGVLNIPSLTAGCTCNYSPVSLACVPAGIVERSGAE